MTSALKDSQHRKEEFLRELTQLSLRCGIEICGCGCCGSPALIELEDADGRYLVDCDDEMLGWIKNGKSHSR